MGLIYALLHPRYEIIRYVGVTLQGLRRRHASHISIRTYRPERQRTRKEVWILSLADEGALPDIALIEEFGGELPADHQGSCSGCACIHCRSLRQRESMWIKHFWLNRCELLNHPEYTAKTLRALKAPCPNPDACPFC